MGRGHVALLIALGMLVLSLVTPARAEPTLHGALDGRGLFELEGRFGGALGTDLWWGSGVLRAGATFGVGALSAGGKSSSRVITPFGLSLALLPAEDRTGPTGVLRVGAYAGAEKGGFIFGPWGGCALGYRFALGEGASVRVGADAWWLWGEHGGVFIGPYVGLGF